MIVIIGEAIIDLIESKEAKGQFQAVVGGANNNVALALARRGSKMRFRHALGEALRETRHEQKHNLRDVAQRGCIALGYLSEIERGHKEVSSRVKNV